MSTMGDTTFHLPEAPIARPKSVEEEWATKVTRALEARRMGQELRKDHEARELPVAAYRPR
jgi:hypothetical protein